MSSIRNALRQVRLGHHEKEFDVLVNYLDGVTCVANLMRSDHDRFSVYRNAIEVLYETICDPLVSEQWRYYCLDHVYKPLLKAERYAKSESDRIALARIKIDMQMLVPHFL
ncbi:hypothetical protein [Alteromonas abrolhosensis]|jgi:hypothetical protein|uniref:hypothetical protein n=1 Tax=Alteromonas abrolhosensis TaxID=1892904 RepID=UPI000B301B94